MNIAAKIGENIERQMQSNNVGLIELANAIGVTRQTLFNYIKGNSAIDSVRLLAIAQYFGIEPSKLLQTEEAPLQNSLLFRSSLAQQDSTQRVLDTISHYLALYNQAMYNAQLCHAYIPAYYNLLVQYQQGAQSLNEQYSSLKITDALKQNIEQLALHQRQVLRITEYGALPAIEAIISTGIHIIFLKLDSEDIFGLSTIDKKYGAFIIINDNSSITLERKIFTIIHEYAHLILHHPLFERASNEKLSAAAYKTMDKMADYFAGCFLCPKDYLERMNRKYNGNWNFDCYINCKHELQVSLSSLIMSLYNNKYISKGFKDSYFKLIQQPDCKKIEIAPLIDSFPALEQHLRDLCQKDLISALRTQPDTYSIQDICTLLQCTPSQARLLFASPKINYSNSILYDYLQNN